MDTERAYMFMLTNGTIQASFDDDTMIIYDYSLAKKIIYSKNEDEWSYYKVEDAKKSDDAQMVKNLDFMLGILYHGRNDDLPVVPERSSLE